MGQTGAGKSTLLDSFLNFLIGIDYYDNFRYKLIDEKELIREREAILRNKGVAEENIAKSIQIFSMTSEVCVYHIPSEMMKQNPFSDMPCCINVIDTPGLGDTRGAEWD